MSKLVQKPTVDKNGKNTTVYVNPDKENGAAAERVKGAPAQPPHIRPARNPLRRVSLHPVNYTAAHWRISREYYDFNPPYQRGSVWTLEQKQNLIRSYLMGIPTGSIITNTKKGAAGYSTIIDGKQRLEATLGFMDDEFAVPVEWFDEEDYSGGGSEVYFSELSKVFQRSFSMTTPTPVLEAHCDTVEEEAEIFFLINSAGSAQEEAHLAAVAKQAGL